MSAPSSPASTAEQRRLAGRYLLREPVGRGGAGVVWKASDELLGRTVAIKECMLPPTVDDVDRDKLLTRVMREARTAAGLDHPALVTVFDVVQESGRPWIVMEYVESRSLSQVVRQDGPMPVAQVVDIGLTLLDALYVAHSAGVLHRDVKPANVLLTEAGNVVLTDFGIAATTGDPTLTTSGMLLGSPSYMPPERARGEAATPDSDVWSLAATLYTLVEGTTPYSGDHPLAVLSAVAEHRRRPMENAGPLEPLLAEILDSEPEERPGELAVRRRLERIKGQLAAAHGPATTGGTPIRTIATTSEKSPAERTARLSTRRPSREQDQAPASAVPVEELEPGDDRNSDPSQAPGGSSAAEAPAAEKSGRRSRWRRRLPGAAAAAGAAGVEADEPSWDFDGLFGGRTAPADNAPADTAPAAPQTAPTEPAAAEDAAPETAAPEPAAPEAAAPETAAPETAAPETEATEAAPAEPMEPGASEPVAGAGAGVAADALRRTAPTTPATHTAPDSAAAPSTPTAAPTPAQTTPERAPSPPRTERPAGTAGSPPPQQDRRRRSALLLGAGALVVVAVVALALILTGGGSNKPTAVPGVQAPSGGTNTGSGSGSGTSSSSSSTPSSGTGAAVPAGWRTYRDSKFGWSIAVPPEFRQTTGGTTNQTDFRDSTGRLLRVEIAPQAHASAIGDWHTYEPTFASQVSNYQRVRIEPSDGGDGTRAADWEFTYQDGGADLHVLNRGVVDGHTAHALYWQTPDSSWASSTALRDQIFSTFQPPPQ